MFLRNLDDVDGKVLELAHLSLLFIRQLRLIFLSLDMTLHSIIHLHLTLRDLQQLYDQPVSVWPHLSVGASRQAVISSRLARCHVVLSVAEAAGLGLESYARPSAISECEQVVLEGLQLTTRPQLVAKMCHRCAGVARLYKRVLMRGSAHQLAQPMDSHLLLIIRLPRRREHRLLRRRIRRAGSGVHGRTPSSLLQRVLFGLNLGNAARASRIFSFLIEAVVRLETRLILGLIYVILLLLAILQFLLVVLLKMGRFLFCRRRSLHSRRGRLVCIIFVVATSGTAIIV